MKRTDAEREVSRAIVDNPHDYAKLIEVMVKESVISWDDDQLAYFLWGDDDSQTIEPD